MSSSGDLEAVNPADRKLIEPMLVSYLHASKGWTPDEFRLDFKGWDESADCVVVTAVYLEDERRATPGAGKSVQLHVDRGEVRVVRELRFQ